MSAADSPVTIPLGSVDSPLRLHATESTRRSTRRGVVPLPAAVEAWLFSDVAPGSVLYDIGAGVGAVSLTAAVRRNAVVVAFEPGFAAFHELCDNVILNGCAGTVVPLPLALGARAGLRPLDYPHRAGSDHHALRGREWRAGRDVPRDRYTQPVCAETLDDVVRRHRLEPPHAVLIAVRSGAADVLRGARGALEAHRPRSILVVLKDDADAAAVQEVAAQAGYRAAAVAAAPSGRGTTLNLVPDAERPRPRATIWRRLRKGIRRKPAGRST